MAFDPKIPVDLDTIEPNSTVLLKGIISYSHVTSKVTGDELARYNARRKFPIGEHTNITLSNAEVVTCDPNNPTLAEIYVAQHLYTSQNQERYPGLSYSATNKGSYLPAVGVRQADGTCRQVWPTAELATGQPAFLLLRVFPTRMSHQGITFDVVIIDAPEVQYRQGGNRLTSDLAKHGIVWQPTNNPEAANDSTPTSEQISNTLNLQEAMAQAPVAMQTMPVQQAPAMQQPVQQPFTQQQNPMAQPAQQPFTQQPFAQQQNPTAVPLNGPIVGGSIVYNPNDL